MAKAKRSLFRPLLFSLLLLVIPVAVAPFVPLTPLKPGVEAKLSELLGRPVTVGSLRLGLFGGPYLFINQVTAAEDPAFGEGTLLRADQVRANFSVISFVFRREVEIDSIKLEAPDIRFVKNPAGVWSWTTIGRPLSASATTPAAVTRAGASVPMPAMFGFLLQSMSEASIRKIAIERATVTLADSAGDAPSTLYRNITLQTDIDRQPDNRSLARGRLQAQSEEVEGAQLLKADMPFELTIDRSQTPALAVNGKVGPGAVESKNLAADSFQSLVEIKGGVLTLDQMALDLYEGSLRGNLRLNLADQRFTAEGEVENLNLDQALAAKLQMAGQLTGYITAKYKLGGLMRGFQEMVPTIGGSGRVTSNGLYIASVNLSEQVARALKLDQIGDMSQGTKTGALAADFQIDQGVVHTSGLQIQQLDGLGDATSDQGWFKVETSPTLGYAVSLLLSNEATTQIKSTSPLVGVAVTMLEVNNRIAVPVNLAGDVRSPQVEVDVRKFILGF